MNIEDILAKLTEISDAGETRSLTDDEVTTYEALETQLKAAQKTQELRSRTAAYQAPNASVAAVVNVGTPAADDTLNRAFEAYLRTGQPNADIAELRAQGSADSAGGYTVAPAFRDKLGEVQKAFGGLAAEVETITTETGATLEYPSNNDTANSGSITAESAPFANGADLVFGTVALGAWKYTSSGAGTTTPLRVPVELLQDSAFDVSGLIARKLGERILRKQAVDWVRGAGTTLPFGLLHAGLTTDVTLATEATITYAKLLELESELDPAHEANAKWIMNKATWSAIRGIVDGEGRPLIFESAASGMGTAPRRQLLGYDVIIDQSCINVTQDGVDGHFIGLGDFREAYVIRRVAPLTVVVNPWTRANNGEVEFTAYERADGNIQNRSAYVIADNITT